ncbi:MAG: VWA domain-containing protein [Prevotellaceae bacterium]|nr:VWA domain-containing protein [Prevotellaceae bacterium]
MFRFANPEYLYLLAAPAVLLPLYVAMWFRSRRSWKRFGDVQLLRGQTLLLSCLRPHLKFALVELALVTLCLMLARPQTGKSTATESRAGIEVVFMVDVSNSMLAEDVSPNRLECSKLLVTSLLENMHNDQVALGVFAGEAYPQMPITGDHVSARMFLDNITTGMVTLQGTNLQSAIDLARVSFSSRKGVGRAIVIITDGETHEGNAVESARAARKEGKLVYVLGVGSREGGHIPTSDGLLTDESGAPVLTRVDADSCRKVAEAGGGVYIPVDNSNYAQRVLREELSKLQKGSEVVRFSASNEQFTAFGLILFVLLVAEFFIRDARNPLFDRFRLFK